jgi:hypothetical protein
MRKSSKKRIPTREKSRTGKEVERKKKKWERRKF